MIFFVVFVLSNSSNILWTYLWYQSKTKTHRFTLNLTHIPQTLAHNSPSILSHSKHTSLTPPSVSSSLPFIIFLSLSALTQPPLSFFFLILAPQLQISTCFAMHGSTEQTRSGVASHYSATQQQNMCLPAISSLSRDTHPPPCLSLPPTATPWLSRIFREQWHSAETKITLHPEEASGAHQQVPEAVHLKTKCNLLTTIPEAEVMF